MGGPKGKKRVMTLFKRTAKGEKGEYFQNGGNLIPKNQKYASKENRELLVRTPAGGLTENTD